MGKEKSRGDNTDISLRPRWALDLGSTPLEHDEGRQYHPCRTRHYPLPAEPYARDQWRLFRGREPTQTGSALAGCRHRAGHTAG